MGRHLQIRKGPPRDSRQRASPPLLRLFYDRVQSFCFCPLRPLGGGGGGTLRSAGRDHHPEPDGGPPVAGSGGLGGAGRARNPARRSARGGGRERASDLSDDQSSPTLALSSRRSLRRRGSLFPERVGRPSESVSPLAGTALREIENVGRRCGGAS